MSKIEVGMRVRCVDPHGCEEFYSAGAEGVVTKITGYSIFVKFDSGKFDSDCGRVWSGDPDWFEPVYTPTAAVQTIHTIADELRLTPDHKFTKARLVELCEMLEMACKRIEDAGKTE